MKLKSEQNTKLIKTMARVGYPIRKNPIYLIECDTPQSRFLVERMLGDTLPLWDEKFAIEQINFCGIDGHNDDHELSTFCSSCCMCMYIAPVRGGNYKYRTKKNFDAFKKYVLRWKELYEKNTGNALNILKIRQI